jgi:hypothetical protein
MINLTQWIDQQVELERLSILDNVYPEFLPQPIELCERIKHNLDRDHDSHHFDYDLDDPDIQDLIYDWFYMNYDNNLHLAYGYWSSTNEISLFNIEEHEICLQGLKITDWRKNVINAKTDLYIPDSNNQYGYVCDHSMVIVKYDINDIAEHIRDHLSEAA